MSDAPEVVVHAHPEHGEGPVWADGVLYWVDIAGGTLHRYDPATGEDTKIAVAGQALGAVVPRASGGLVLAVRDGFAELPPGMGEMRLIAPVEIERTDHRMNDGKCDPRGRFWASTMAFDGTAGAGALYCLDRDLQVRRVLDGLTIGNGLAWSADERTFFFIDSQTRGVDAYPFEPATGELGDPRRIIEIPEDDGVPDGMCLDADGYLWVAIYGGWCVRRFSPDGELDREIRFPVSNVTCPTFGGPDLGELYVTTTSDGLSDDERGAQPLAGAVFRARPGVTGVPTAAFAG